MSGYFVTGTDTDAGKTVACAYLMLALGADYWKPIQSGLAGESDEAAVRRLTGLPGERFHPSSYRLTEPLSPHEAARRDGVAISLDRVELPRSPRAVIVEGAGGILVPLNGEQLMSDLMKKLALPVVLVARGTLGTINHTLLSLEALRARRLAIAGVIVSGACEPSNLSAIEHYGRAAILAVLPRFEPLDAATLGAFARSSPPRLKGIA